MVDNKKIEEAAANYAEENQLYIEDQMGDMQNGIEELSEAYKTGAHWAIKEFLKDLWHPASEEPRKDVPTIIETHNDKNMFYYVWNRWQDNFYPFWTDAVICSRVSRWLYIDDLLPKEGGEK